MNSYANGSTGAEPEEESLVERAGDKVGDVAAQLGRMGDALRRGFTDGREADDDDK